MANPDHLAMIRKGSVGVAEWRNGDRFRSIDLRGANLADIELANVDLSGADLQGANLTRANLENANLSSADLTTANLEEARLVNAQFGYGGLEQARLRNADLTGAVFDIAGIQKADLTGAVLSNARLDQVGLQGAILRGADLSRAWLHECGLDDADLAGADLQETNFHHVELPGANLQDAKCAWTIFAAVDLSLVRGLESVVHAGPSHLAQSTLLESKGRIPHAFLHGCGFSEWEILGSRLYDSSLSASQISELQYKIFDLRVKGLFARRAFISYAHDDSLFVDKLNSRLFTELIITWLDRHDAIAGSMEKQVSRAIGANDVVILVLSKNAIESDWVENELDLALEKEKREGRDVICPIALDDSWSKMLNHEARSRHLWRKLPQMLVIDFSDWHSNESFEKSFGKLLRGLSINYESTMG